MRRSFKRPRKRRIKIPRQILPDKPSRPKRSELKKIYKELLTTSQEQRVNALAKALHWFDKVQVYLAFKNKGKWTVNQLKNKNKMEKVRTDSIHSSKLDVKIECLQKSIAYYEQMCTSYKPPLLNSFLHKLKKSKKKLEATQERLEDKHSKFINMMQEAFQPVGRNKKPVKLAVGRLNYSYIVNENSITFDKSFIVAQRRLIRKKGLLSSAIDLVQILAKPVATVPVLNSNNQPTGKTTLDPYIYMPVVISLLQNFNNYCMREDAPRTIVRRAKPKKESTNG